MIGIALIIINPSIWLLLLFQTKGKIVIFMKGNCCVTNILDGEPTY
jgi:hypothetical protein